MTLVAKTFGEAITFSRPSTGWRYNKNGLLEPVSSNLPRFQYNPSTGEKVGIQIEEQRTNLWSYSEQFDNAAWSSGNGITITPDDAISPDGTQTADLAVASLAPWEHRRNYSVTVGVTYCLSIMLKSVGNGDGNAIITFSGANGTFNSEQININLLTGTITGTSGPVVASGVEPVGNGFYRFWVSATCAATGSANIRVIKLTATSGDAWAWGAQFEQGAFPTSYIKTEASQVTRSADIATMPIGGEFNATEWGFVVDAHCPSRLNQSNPHLLRYDDGAANDNNRIALFRNGISGAGIRLLGNDAGVSQFDITINGLVDQRNRIAVRIKANDVAMSVNGSAPVKDSAATIVGGLLTRRLIGRGRTSGFEWNSTIRDIFEFPFAPTDAQLQAWSAL